MPDGLSLRSALLLVALAFGLTFCVQALLSGGSPAAKPAAKQSAHGSVVSAPGAEPDSTLAAAAKVPALRDARKQKPSVRRVVQAAPTVAPAPVVPTTTMSPTPTAAPPYIPPAPRRVAPKPVPEPAPTSVPKPAPTSTPPDSGGFDTYGEP